MKKVYIVDAPDVQQVGPDGISYLPTESVGAVAETMSDKGRALVEAVPPYNHIPNPTVVPKDSVLQEKDGAWQAGEGGGGTENGIPSGGTTGQVLVKKSDTDYDVEWTNGGGGTNPPVVGEAIVGEAVLGGGGTEHGIPSGGTTGQVLAKNSSTDYDVEWVNAGGSSSLHLIFPDAETATPDSTMTIDDTTYNLYNEVNGVTLNDVIAAVESHTRVNFCSHQYDSTQHSGVIRWYELRGYNTAVQAGTSQLFDIQLLMYDANYGSTLTNIYSNQPGDVLFLAYTSGGK